MNGSVKGAKHVYPKVRDQHFARGIRLTPAGRKASYGCDGGWEEACFLTAPNSRFTWCAACRTMATARQPLP